MSIADHWPQIEFDIAAERDDVTRRDHELRCHHCGQWLPLCVFTDLPAIECRPRCGMCRIKETTQSPA